MNEYQIGLILFFTGIAVSFINSIAGGGSALSLPIFLFLGLPVDICNGTNRLGILFGNLSSSKKLHKSGEFEFSSIKPFIIPLALGSFIGGNLVIGISEFHFKLLLISVLVFSVIQMLIKLKKRDDSPKHSTVKMGIVFFLVGLYGGFIQAGMGFVLIMVLSWMGFKKSTQINGMKSTLAIGLVLLGVLPFIFEGQVNYKMALFFGIGTSLGGWLGGFFQTKVKEGLIRYFTIALNLILIIKLGLSL